MADRGGPDAAAKRLLERARLAIFGHLAPAILHETNNVLTVMAGVRQIMKSGAAVSDRIGTMIDEQLQRMDELVTSIRRIGPDEGAGETGRRTLPVIADVLEAVVRLAGKGRGVSVERGEFASAAPADAEALLLVTLCLVLPLLPPRGASGASRLRMDGPTAEQTVSLVVRFSPLREVPAPEDEAVARSLIHEIGGTCDVRITGTQYEATIVVPAAD